MMALSELTPESNLGLRLLAYSNERFPLWQAAGQFPMFLTAYTVGRMMVGERPAFTLNLFLGCLALIAYTLMVRCIDDHKDAPHDNAYYPERVLQRGIVTFTNLKVVAILCVLLIVGVSLYIDRGIGLATMWLLLIFITNNLVQFVQVKWASLGEWLEARRVLLALTVIPFWGFGSVWAAQMGAGKQLVTAQVWWLVASWCVAALLLEIARKSRTPEDTRDSVADYTKETSSWTTSLGLRGTVVTLLVLATAVTAIEAGMLNALGVGVWWAYLALGLTLLLPIGAGIRFAVRPDRFTAKDVSETSAGLWLIGQIICSVALFLVH